METREMTVNQIKEAMLKHKDFYGGDIIYSDEIKKAKTKKQLAKIMDRYFGHLEDIARDAQSHHERFKKELGLLYL